MKRFALSDLPPAMQKQALAQLNREPTPAGNVIPQKPVAPKRIRQNAAGMNNTEQAFFDYLRELSPGFVLPQAIALKLGNGVRYTPDFFEAKDATNEHTERVTECAAYEVKGFMRDDAAVKLKVAAAQYPWIKFHLVTRAKGGAWNIQHVLA